MFKGLGNLASLLKHAHEMQARMNELKEHLGRVRVEGTAGGGLVTIEASGHQRILAVRIDPSLTGTDDREMLEELVAAATNQALEKAKQAAAEQMARLTDGIDIPGLGDALAGMGLGSTGTGTNDGTAD